jgi:hypothetical protein
MELETKYHFAVLYNQKYALFRTVISLCHTFYLRRTSHYVSESNVQEKRYLIKCDIPIPNVQLAYPIRLYIPGNFTPICRCHFTCHVLTFFC